MKIATIPVGYYEALDRSLSNKGFVKIGDHFCPIIGRISMNISTIDVSEIMNIKIGDEVIVISNNLADKNSITNISKLTQTIEYENLVHIPQHLKRVIV
jgi:alanine racemase